MTKVKFVRSGLVLLAVMILIGVALMAWMLVTDYSKNVIQVFVSDDATEILQFKRFGLIPGDQCQYEIDLTSSILESYDLKLDFVETEEKTLKHYARVKIESGEDVLYDELMADIFEKDDLVLKVDVPEKKNTELIITYYIPLEVGNEAKGAVAIFELLLTATPE